MDDPVYARFSNFKYSFAFFVGWNVISGPTPDDFFIIGRRIDIEQDAAIGYGKVFGSSGVSRKGRPEPPSPL